MADDATFLPLFDKSAGPLRRLLATLVEPDDLEAAVRDVRAAFAAMTDEMPYADRPDHVMYGSTFGVFWALAVYKALRPRGFDAHRVGRAFLAALPVNPPQPLAEAPPKMRADAEASQRDAAPNEFVFDIVDGALERGELDSAKLDSGKFDWGMNITSCAVCHAFARHDAMALVPYMCATDDAMSDAGGQGLRRTSTIGLGAHQCDFRFKAGGEPLRLAEQFPDAIRLKDD